MVSVDGRRHLKCLLRRHEVARDFQSVEDNSLHDQGDKADGDIRLDEFRHPVIDQTDCQFVIEHPKASLNVGQSLWRAATAVWLRSVKLGNK